MQGISQLKDTIIAVKKYYNNALTVKGILLTRYNEHMTLTTEVEELVTIVARQMGSKVLNAKISVSISAAESPAHKMSVIKYAPRSKAAKDYMQAIEELYGEDFDGESYNFV